MLKNNLKYFLFTIILLGYFGVSGQELNQRYYYGSPLWQDFRKVLPYSDTSFFVVTQSWAPADLSSYQTQIDAVNTKGELLNNTTVFLNIVQNFLTIGDINYASDGELLIAGSILGRNMVLKLNGASIEWSKVLIDAGLNLTVNDYFAESSPGNYIVAGHRVIGDYGFILDINSAGQTDSVLKINSSDNLSDVKSFEVYPANDGGYYVVINQNRTDLISFWDSYFCILKVNETLGVEWNRSYYIEGEGDFSEIYGFLETDTSLVFTGRHDDNITLLQFDKFGNPELAKKITVGANEPVGWGSCVISNNSGGYLLSSGVPSPSSASTYQSILIDLNANGVVNWARKYNPGQNASFSNLIWVNDELIGTGRVVSNEKNIGLWLNTKIGNVDCYYEDITDKTFLSNTIIQNYSLPAAVNSFSTFTASTDAFLSAISDINPEDSSCTYTKDVVYPGDANFDQISNIYDLLPIGVYYNSNGNLRPNASLDWVGQWSEDWGDVQENGADIKHIDCDGSGEINLLDVEAIELNYANTHNSTQRTEQRFSPNDGPEIYINFPENVPEAIQFSSEVIYGTSDNPAENVYGICFVLDYSISPVPIADIQFIPDPSWLGTSDSVLFVAKHLPDEKRLEIGLVKTTGNNARISFGPIGTVYIVTEDNIIGRPISDEIIIDIIDIEAISNVETVLPVAPRNNQTVVTGIKNELLNHYFSIAPNPANENIQIQIPTGGSSIEKVVIYNSSGIKVLEIENSQKISIKDLPNGIYWISISNSKGNSFQKLIKQ